MAEQTFGRIVIARRGGPSALELRNERVPLPSRDQILLRVHAAGVAYADVLMREGIYPGCPPRPFSPGYDVVGEVAMIGPDTRTSFREGDRVAALTVFGGYSEYILVPATRLVAVPENVSSTEAVALVLNYLTGYQMLRRAARVERGERLLVHGGAGGVGTAVLNLAQLEELEVYATASKAKHNAIRALGATPIDYEHADFVSEIRRMTQDGVDVVLDPIGGRHWWRSYQTLRPLGRLVGYGYYEATHHGRLHPLSLLRSALRVPRFTLLRLLPDGKAVVGYSVIQTNLVRSEFYRQDLAHLLSLLAEKRIKPQVATVLPLEKAGTAHELLGGRKVIGKIVLSCIGDKR